MINLFPPGNVTSTEGFERDNMTLEEAQAARERKLREYFGEDEEVPEDHERWFVAFAESYFNAEHLDNVASLRNFLDWEQMKQSILERSYHVPDIRTAPGLADARQLLYEYDYKA